MLKVTADNLLFVTCDITGYIECVIAYWILACIPIILTVFGIVGNILNISVLLRKQLRKKSTCIFLLFLAVSDSIFLCSGPLLQSARILYGCPLYAEYPKMCNIPRWLAHSSGFISCWLIVCVTIERSLVSLFPVTARQILTPRNSLIVSLGIILLAASYNGHLLYGYTITKKENFTSLNNTEIYCMVSCSVRQDNYGAFYDTTWNLMVSLSVFIVPIFLVVTGNAIVGLSLFKRQRALRLVHHQDRTVEGNENINTQSRSTKYILNTKIFFILSGVYIFTTLPYGVFILKIKQHQLVDEHTFSKYQLMNSIVACFLSCNFSFNFLLYFMTGSLFKVEFKNMIVNIINLFQIRTRTRNET